MSMTEPPRTRLQRLEAVGIPSVLLVGAADAQLDDVRLIEEEPHLVADCLDIAVKDGEVHGEDALAQFFDRPAVAGHTDHALQLFGGENLLRALFDQQDADIGELHRQHIALLGVGEPLGGTPQLRFHMLDVGEVEADGEEEGHAVVVGEHGGGRPDDAVRGAALDAERILPVLGQHDLADDLIGDLLFAEDPREDEFRFKLGAALQLCELAHRVIDQNAFEAVVPEHGGLGKIHHECAQALLGGFELPLLHALPVEHEAQAQHDGDDRVGIEDQVDKIVLVAVRKGINDQKNRQQRKG